MNNDLENITQMILNQIRFELDTIIDFRSEVRKERSEIIKNLSVSYVTLTKMSVIDDDKDCQPLPIGTTRGF